MADKLNKDSMMKVYGELEQAVEVLDDLVDRLSFGKLVEAGNEDRQYKFGLEDAHLTAIKLHGILRLLKDNIDNRIIN